MNCTTKQQVARRIWIFVAVAALLPPSARAAPEVKPVVPAGVRVSQQQHERWASAFAAWRSAESTWRGESVDESKLRAKTRLLILPSATPLLSRQRGLDGSAIVLSSGLMTLLDEMLLAEAVSVQLDSNGPTGAKPQLDCFDTYGQRVLTVVSLNRVTPSSRSPEVLSAWPRFSTIVEAGQARTIGETYETKEAADARRTELIEAAKKAKTRPPPEIDKMGGPCKAVTPAMLHRSDTQARLAESADALALWLFTQQHLQLARLPSLARPASSPADKDMQKGDDGAGGPQQDECAAPASAAASASAVVSQPRAPSSALTAGQRARQAVCASGRQGLPRTADWLNKYMMYFDAGIRPVIKP